MTSNHHSGFDRSLGEALDLHNNGQIDEAILRYRNLLETTPDNPDLWNLLGVAAHQKSNNALAENLISTAISLNENIAHFHNNLGMVYRGLNRDEDADQAFRRAIKLDPKHSNALSNLAALLRQTGEFAAALDYARQAVNANPESAEALVNLGNAEKDNGYSESAVTTYRRAISAQHDFALAHWNLALSLLSLGDMAEGFEEMAWRWKWNDFPGIRRNFFQPNWNGEDLKGKKVFLHPEQGLGDTIHFMRYAPIVKQLADYVYLELPQAIVPLAQKQVLADEIINQGDTLPDFDFHAPFMDLPRILGTTLETIPADGPYLLVDPKLRQKWRNWKQQYSGTKIGLNWYGNPANPAERFRKIPPEDLTPLSDLAGINWFNLQKDEGTNVSSDLSDKFNLIDTGPSPLQETAALIMELDLVITTDTAVAHLAGALGKPVWILLHHAPDWRWLTSGDTNLWYPTARLFRQSTPGDWQEVIENVIRELKVLCNN